MEFQQICWDLVEFVICLSNLTVKIDRQMIVEQITVEQMTVEQI